jgi:type IV pilus assembly protein PilZ
MATDRPNGGSGPVTVSRPGVLSLNIREKAALYAAYMPFLKGGGIFIPTSRVYQLGEEVFMLLSLMDDPQRIAVQGKVVWVTPEGVQGNRTQGIGVLPSKRSSRNRWHRIARRTPCSVEPREETRCVSITSYGVVPSERVAPGAR